MTLFERCVSDGAALLLRSFNRVDVSSWQRGVPIAHVSGPVCRLVAAS
jgi:hypothetical protein